MAMVPSDGGAPPHSETDDSTTQMPPYTCVLKGAGDAMAGAAMGSVFGFGSTLLKKQGFKAAIVAGATSAKTFAILSGIHGFVSTLLVQVRGKKDAMNAGIAGCATGLALSVPGTPQSLLQGCVSFGAFSYIMELMSARTAIAAAAANSGKNPAARVSRQEFAFPSLPPFMLAPIFGEGLFIYHQPKIKL